MAKKKTKNVKLKPCPFCGEIPKILICDEEGNVHNEEYINHPYSGLSFALTHTNYECPVGVEEDEILGCVLYETIDELEKAWNNRK